ncbi:short chain alcohol dehydrogenase [Gluconacetobacter johannae DSM 13595]|uniref:SDR family NAD(P)-dependent oxidoreductase n=1 Tax=Gluconacetobacter johannae TaxID=112140 RepID=UPI0021567C46|nr:SDR family NAD(P)-dependent oxidoreductase [Gluconacetobacter johannae]GBQ86361.1 short chain alcohol dehydrogenase [Gluconacetobacter johannae DSM 13595]
MSTTSERPESRPLAVVTGATGGIGREIVALLVGSGYRVTILARGGAASPGVASGGPAWGAHVAAVSCDLARVESIAQAAAAIVAAGDPVMLLVHCAGVISPGQGDGLCGDGVARQVAVNLTAPMLLTSRLLECMPRGGHVVFVNSMAGVMPLQGSGVYAATKFGLRGYALSLALDLRPRGIRVSSVFPGAVDTPMLWREMAEGGSVLNFVSPPAAPADVARRIVAVCRRPRREVFLPPLDGMFANLCLLLPGVLRLSLPLLTFSGRRGYRRFQKRCGPVE